MKYSFRAPLLVLLATLVVAGCARDAGATPGGATPSVPERPDASVPPFATVPASGAPVTGEVPTDIMDRVVADAAERSSTDAATIEVIRAERVTWSDGSLGCPEPGMAYTQALVDGYHVVVRAADEELDYRVTESGGFRLCEGSNRPGG